MDTLIIEKAIHGDKEAFGRIFDAHYQRILNYCYKHVVNVAIAQDLTSEVFLSALEKIKQYSIRNKPIENWLYKIATRKIIDYYRKKKLSSLQMFIAQTGYQPASADQLEAEIIAEEERVNKNKQYQAVLTEISKLIEKYKTPIILKYLEEKSISDISQILGIPEGTVKSLLFRGRKHIKESILKELQP